MFSLTSIQVKELTAVYRHPVICRLSFELLCPNFLVICGKNGAGKSTLLHCFGGTIPYQGTITLNHTLPLSSHAVRQRWLTLLSQHNPLHFSISVLDLVLMGKQSRKKWLQKITQQEIEQAHQLLERLGIAHLQNRDAKTLSGGEQQLVWLAQVALQETPLLLLDEPTHFLDIANKHLVFNWLQELVQQQNRTVICVTHDLYQLRQLSGQILNLSMPYPQLEPLSPASIEQHIQYLVRL